jgi:hypothetical protein
MSRLIVLYKLTDVSEVRAPSILAVIVLIMETVHISETSFNLYKTTRRDIPEGCCLHTLECKNVKSHSYFTLFHSLIINMHFKNAARNKIFLSVCNDSIKL